MSLHITARVKRSVLKQMAVNASRRAERVVAKAAHDIEAGAKNNCPVGPTGNLKSSIQARPVGPATWEVRVGASYGIYVHDGTRRMRPRPFLAQAVNDVQPAFEAAVAQLIKGS